MATIKKLLDGIFFLLVGLALGTYSVMGYQNSFNHDITQSPYLFPFIISVFFLILSVSLMYQGTHTAETEETPSVVAVDGRGVLAVLGISALYYGILYFAPLPTIMIGFGSFVLTIANFEVASLLYLFALLFVLGVRKKLVLILVPVVLPLLLSVGFRTMLYVMLP